MNKAHKLGIAILFLISILQSSYAFVPRLNPFSDCIFTKDKNPYEILVADTRDLREIVDFTKKKEQLMQADITYGGLGLRVGTADIYLNTSDGKIVDLNIVADVGVLGFNERIHPRVTIDQMLAGQPLEFRMNGSDRGVLIVQPLGDMTEHGGTAMLNVWNGKDYDQEVVSIRKENGKFVAARGEVTSGKKIDHLKIRMGGYSIPNMYVKNYNIKTK